MASITLRKEKFEELLSDRGVSTNGGVGALLDLDNSTISRIRSGEADPGAKFIAHSLLRFPVRFDDLFEVSGELDER